MNSQSPASSIVYALWLRTRAILLASVAGALVIPLIAPALSPIPRAILSMIAGLAFISGLAVLMGFVTYGGADLSTAESVFPRHMFVFPVRTRSLALVPMLYDPPVVVLFWVLLALGAFAPVIRWRLWYAGSFCSFRWFAPSLRSPPCITTAIGEDRRPWRP
jgi:hypothetical protein